MTVGFLPLGDLNSSQFRSFARSQWQLVLFLYKISMTLSFVPLRKLQWWLILFVYANLKTVSFQWLSVFFCYEISKTVLFHGGLCSITRFQWWPVLFGYEISLMVGFVSLFFYEILKTDGFVPLRDFNGSFIHLRDFNEACFIWSWDFCDSRFCSVTRSQWLSVLFLYEISMTVGFHCQSVLFSYEISIQLVLFHYEISMTVGFIRLRDFNDGRFCLVVRSQWRSVLFHLRDLSDGQFYSVMRFQWQSSLKRFKLSIFSVSFVPLQDFNDVCFVWLRKFNGGLFCFFVLFTRFQWRLVLFLGEISMTVRFVPFKDDRFCFVTRVQWW